MGEFDNNVGSVQPETKTEQKEKKSEKLTNGRAVRQFNRSGDLSVGEFEGDASEEFSDELPRPNKFSNRQVARTVADSKRGYARGVREPSVERGYARGRREPSVERDYASNAEFSDSERGYARGVWEPSVERGYARLRREPSVERGYARLRREPSVERSYARGRRGPSVERGYALGRRRPSVERDYGRWEPPVRDATQFIAPLRCICRVAGGCSRCSPYYRAVSKRTAQ